MLHFLSGTFATTLRLALDIYSELLDTREEEYPSEPATKEGHDEIRNPEEDSFPSPLITHSRHPVLGFLASKLVINRLIRHLTTGGHVDVTN